MSPILRTHDRGIPRAHASNVSELDRAVFDPCRLAFEHDARIGNLCFAFLEPGPGVEPVQNIGAIRFDEGLDRRLVPVREATEIDDDLHRISCQAATAPRRKSTISPIVAPGPNTSATP